MTPTLQGRDDVRSELSCAGMSIHISLRGSSSFEVKPDRLNDGAPTRVWTAKGPAAAQWNQAASTRKLMGKAERRGMAIESPRRTT